MAEAEADPLAGTNLEHYNSPEHKALRLKAAESESAWDGAGQEEGVRVWRIEKFKVKDWPQEDYGQFFGGDSFIVLHSYKEGDSEAMLYNVHFWLGSNTSQDEAGTAAYKTVELDDLLGDVPVQFREVQGHESKSFTSLFPNGMTILEGGVDSGFRHVEPENYTPRLLRFKLNKGGKKKTPNVCQVDMNVKSLCLTDCYVLDMGNEIICFRPEGASVWEKRAVNDYVSKVWDMRNGRMEKFFIDFSDGDDNPGARKFWEQFGGKPEELPQDSPAAANEKAKADQLDNHTNKIYVINNDSGVCKLSLAQSGVLDDSILKEEADDVLLVDVGCCIWGWVGSGANKAEQSSLMIHAQNLIEAGGRPMWTPVRRICQGKEPALFKKVFGVETVDREGY